MNKDMNTRIGDLMRKRGIKPFPFSKAIGVKSSTMTSIFKGEVNFENIRIDTFIKIARGLGMTAEELYYGSEPEQPVVTPEEQHMIDVYRDAPQAGRDMIDAVINTAARQIDESVIKEARGA
jgi:transcriptional regulator with XRE-family HTH domain